jgi:hypothetical protein
LRYDRKRSSYQDYAVLERRTECEIRSEMWFYLDASCYICQQDMSTNNNVSKGNSSARLSLLGGILAFGLLASAIAGSQMLTIAVAQTSGEEKERTVTSIDDIDCDKVKSVVHCVQDVTVAEPEDAGVNSAPFNHAAGTPTVSSSGTASVKVPPDKFSKAPEQLSIAKKPSRFPIQPEVFLQKLAR